MGDHAAELLTAAPHGHSVWEETAVPASATPPLDASTRADVLIVGAGYLGLCTALALTGAGASVILLEAHAPGFGAAGRSGGQVIPGLKYDPSELIEMFGPEAGGRLARFAGATAGIVFDLVTKYGLVCGARRTAWIQGIHAPAALARARKRAADWQSQGASVEFLDAVETAKIAGTPIYRGAFVDRRAGAIQPLSYVRELARIAQQEGARVHGLSRVVRLDRRAARWIAVTAHGPTVEADSVVLASNAYMDELAPRIARSIVAANSLQVATAPLTRAQRTNLLPGGEVLSDTRRVIRYYRLDDEGRLLFGGRGPMREPDRASDFVHLERDIATYFPVLSEAPITHRWGGRIAIHPDFLPKLHRPSPGLWVPIGCQGRGIGWQSAMGLEIARLLLETDAAPVLPLTEPKPIPFHAFRALGVSATITVFRLLDRLGIAREV